MTSYLSTLLLACHVLADTGTVDKFVDRTIANLNLAVEFFGYDTLEIPHLDRNFTKKIGPVKMKANLSCLPGLLHVSPIQRRGGSSLRLFDNFLIYRATFEMPSLKAALGRCRFSVNDLVSITAHYGVQVKDTAAATTLLVSRNGDDCYAAIDRIDLSVGSAYVNSGRSFIHHLEDLAVDAIASHVKKALVRRLDQKIEHFKDHYLSKFPFKCYRAFTS